MLILDQSEPLIPIFVFLSSENYLLLSPRVRREEMSDWIKTTPFLLLLFEAGRNPGNQLGCPQLWVRVERCYNYYFFFSLDYIINTTSNYCSHSPLYSIIFFHVDCNLVQINWWCKFWVIVVWKHLSSFKSLCVQILTELLPTRCHDYNNICTNISSGPSFVIG